ncbi:MAG: SMC family ATPase, partial [Thermoplasmatales archaeon]
KIEEEQKNIEGYINQIPEYEKLLSELNLKKENLEKDYKKAMEDYNSVHEKDKELSEHRKYLNKLQEDERKKLEKIKELESKTEELKNMANSITIPEIKYNKDILEEEIEKIQSKINSSNVRIGEIKKDIKNYNDLISKGICPVCKREVHPHEFEKELYSLGKKLQEEERILKELNDQLNGLKGMKKDAEYAEKLVITKQKYLDQMGDKEKLLSTEKEELNNIQEKIKNEKKSLEELSSVPEILEEVKKRVNDLNKSISDINDKITKITAELEGQKARKEETEKRLSDLKKDLDEIEKAKRDVERLSNIISFLDDVFEPAMDDIELSVFANINREMNELVSSWFIKLVPDPQKEIKVDENFAPRVTQSGYDLGIESLSGGEKSAVALSYRLALNSLLNNYSGSLGLLILDEPTDGFSKEQLQKFGDVLRDLNSKQIIIVSHESELENVSDRVIKVEKRDGLSSVELM